MNKALEDSIKHWEEVSVATNILKVHIGADDCALCDLYIDDNCIGCPVFKETGYDCCGNTPHEEVRAALMTWTILPLSRQKAKEFQEAAVKELAFLKGLR